MLVKPKCDWDWEACNLQNFVDIFQLYIYNFPKKILGCGDPRYKHENQEEDGFGEICLYCITICAITTWFIKIDNFNVIDHNDEF